ncbi:winged helix-turn-helix domain-containing protein [Arthrobacter sp. BE255]|uniref:winged helix-turn-helix domain-containing protein n=1 Tax=Arthrobacter sp. BE255 TaxID=2817721 RepID=UPI0037BEB2FE
MNRTRTRILRVLLLEGPATCPELSSKLLLSLSATRRHLNLMASVGLIECVPARRFRASPEKVRGEAEAISAAYLGGVMPPVCPVTTE